jgi:hypothetical protein
VAVTAKRDATRPGLADPHILSMTGWLMAGWLAGRSVGRVGSRALPTGTCASRLFVPPRIRVLLASPRLRRPSYLLLRLFLRVSREPVTLSLEWRATKSRRHFFFPGTAGHRRSRRHRRRYHATVSNRLATGYVRGMDGERARRREKRREKKKRTNGETARSGTEIARLTGNRVKGSKSEGARKKEREGQNRVGRRFPIAKRGPSRSDDDRKR